MITRGIIMTTVALTLAACDRSNPAPEVDSQEQPAEPISIVRADAAIDRAEPALEPVSITVPFADGGSELSEMALSALEDSLASPQMEANGVVTLGGHSDSAGSDAANLRASRQRAEVVRDWLIGQGVAEERITLIAFGEQNPVRPNALPDGSPDETARAANRRVEVTISFSEKHPDSEANDEPASLVEQVVTED